MTLERMRGVKVPLLVEVLHPFCACARCAGTCQRPTTGYWRRRVCDRCAEGRCTGAVRDPFVANEPVAAPVVPLATPDAEDRP